MGVSADTPKSHRKFKEKNSLPFTLLADTEKEMCLAYGVWGEKKFMGKKYMGISRTTFLIDPDGNIAHVFEKVKPKGHAEEVLSVLNQF